MSFLDEETIELYLQKGRLALIVEMSRADYLEADAQAQAAWRARLAGLTELDAADLQRWYALEHLEALFDMLSHPRLRREAGMALCHREIGARCEALVPLIPELGAYATRVMHKHMSLERRLQLARSLPVSQAVSIVGEDDLNAEAVEFLASLLTAAEDAYLADLALSKVSWQQPELFREVLLPHLRSDPPDAFLSMLYRLEREELGEFTALLKRDLDREGSLNCHHALGHLARLGALDPAPYLTHANSWLRAEAAARVGPEHVVAVAQLLADEESEPRRQALERLLEWDASAQAESMVPLLDDEDPSIRKSVKAAFKKWNYKPPKKVKLTIEQQLRQLGAPGEALLAAAIPSVRATLSKSAGKSRLGGRPELPAEAVWPQGLAFAAQFELSECPAQSGLPSKGRLLFFVEPEMLEDGAVLYFESGADLHERATPEGIREFPALPLKLKSELSLPSRYSELAYALDSAGRKRYQRILEDASQGPEDPQHRLLGNGAWVQGDLLQGQADYRLLCQLDSEPKHRLYWGDSGRLFYLWVPGQPLETAAFESQSY